MNKGRSRVLHVGSLARGVVRAIARAIAGAAPHDGTRRECAAERGMTLVEIMVVVVIMTLIATGVAVAVMPQLRKAQQKTSCVRINDIMTAAEMHMMDTSECPSLDDIRATLKGKPEDAWGNEFKVECTGDDELTVISPGRDGNFGTDDDLDPGICQDLIKGKKGE